MVLLGDVGHVESFGTHPMVILADVGQVEARFSPFGNSVILTQDRCTVCAEQTIGSEIIFDAPNGTPS